jgi:hypothetical protein
MMRDRWAGAAAKDAMAAVLSLCNSAQTQEASMADFQGDRSTEAGRGRDAGGMQGDWSNEERYWRDNFSSRPYASADRGFEHYQPGYRYGYESAHRAGGRSFDESENDLRAGWDRYEHRGSNRSTWEEIKHSVKDAWDRVTGSGPSRDRR